MEALFNAASIRVHVPEASSLPDGLSDISKSTARISDDWDDIKTSTERDVAFFDEKLVYFLALFVPDISLDGAGTNGEAAVSQLVKRIQRTMTASFLPPISASRTHPHSRHTTDPSLQHLQMPGTPLTPNTAEPLTPNPLPAVRGGEENYAGVEGVTVWEGDVGPLAIAGMSDQRKDLGSVRRVQGGFEMIWEGEVPIAYVRTQIHNPLLALTASITLRPDAVTRRSHRSNASIATDSAHSDIDEDEVMDDGEDGEAGIVDIDLLGGLAGSSNLVPATRLGPSVRQDLSILDPGTNGYAPLSAITPVTAPHATAPSSASSGPARHTGDLPTHLLPLGSTMRKSFRRVLSLSPGLRVRMRNLVLPQLIPPSGDSGGDDGDDEEKKVVLCVEIENAPDGLTPSLPFRVNRVEVEIGGKGGKATASLTCQPEPSSVFPLNLQPMEQYNLLYGVSVATMTEGEGWEDDQAARAVLRNLGTGEVNRPVSITVIGRPYYLTDSGETRWPTREFNSRWNCNLDLSAYYASLPSFTAPVAGPSKQRSSKPVIVPQNAIVGDKRYSLATLLAGDKEESFSPVSVNRPPSLPPPRRMISGKPMMPSQLANQAGNRLSSVRTIGQGPADEKAGLMISVKMIEDEDEQQEGRRKTVQALEEFSVEVYVSNRTEEVRRFRLSIPSHREDGRVRDSMQRRKEEGMAMDDPALRHSIQQHIHSSPGVICMENDIRCGPLLPGASLNARIRFMALRNGVHRIDKLRVTGVGDDMDFIVSPVLDVVVGDGEE